MSYWGDKSLIIGVSIGILTIPVLLYFAPSLWNLIIGPLVGAFVGTGLGFFVNNLHRHNLENERRLFFKNLLVHEIEKSIELLTEKVEENTSKSETPMNLIPVDGWNSLVNSGDMPLFKDMAIDLSNAYFDIQNYNYEAKRTRDAMEQENLLELTFESEVKRSEQLAKKLDEKWKPHLLELLNKLKEQLNDP